MFRLSSGVGPADRPTIGMMLALAAMVAALGCSPTQSKSTSARTEADQSAQQTSPADQTSARQSTAPAEATSPDAAEQSRQHTPSGPITVDSQGYVTLDPGPDSAAAAPAQSQGASSQSAQTQSAQSQPPSQLSQGEPTLAEPELAQLQSPEPKPVIAPSVELKSAQPTPAEPESADSESSESEAKEVVAVEPPSPRSGVKAELVNSDPANRELSKPEKATSAADAHAADSGLASYEEKHQEIAKDWPKPQALLFFTGQQHGYIEPCGCTGLENQKGGLNRRDTLLQQLTDRGWDVLPMDVGNFERRAGRQAEIKFQTTVDALKDMDYRAATLGVDDLKLSSTHLLSLTATEGKTETPFISSNAYILIEEYMPKSKIIEAGGRKIGVTAILGDSFRKELTGNSDVITSPAAESLAPVLSKLKEAGCDYLVLLAHATLEESQQLAKAVPGFDLVVTSGGYPEPFYQLESIPDSQTKLAQVGAKGMYTVLVGLYPEDGDQPVRYQRVALSSQFPDSPRMLERFANYQKQLQSLGFDGLGLRASTLPDGKKFVGSETCGECHTHAFDVWKESKHAAATESLVHPPNDRSMIPRHYDPECLSCHVTGWNAKSYFPYASGYTSLEETPMLTGSGCENCHGPGSKHVAAENGDVEADAKLLEQLRAQMRLPLAEAKARCLDCHDQDNSPDFQHDGAFEKYWSQIAHPGKD